LVNLDEAAANQRGQRGSRDVQGLELSNRNFSSGRCECVDEFPLVVVEFAFGGLQYGDLYGARGILGC
jgi:hypothetical protein